MQLDHDLIKDILIIFIDSPEPNIRTTDMPKLLNNEYDEKNIIFNMEKMIEEELLGFVYSNHIKIATHYNTGYTLNPVYLKILMAGLSYNDAVKNESFFKKVKTTMQNQALGTTVKLGMMFIEDIGKIALGLNGD